jgi:hypothetical protein
MNQWLSYAASLGGFQICLMRVKLGMGGLRRNAPLERSVQIDSGFINKIKKQSVKNFLISKNLNKLGISL